MRNRLAAEKLDGPVPNDPEGDWVFIMVVFY